MSTATTAGTGKATRAASQRVIVWLRATMRKALEPLLPTAARDAIQVIDEDEQASATLKKSVRRLLVDQREFSSAFFTSVDREIDAAFDELFREGQLMVATTYRAFEIYIAVAIVYLVMTSTAAALFKALERRLSPPV